MEPGAHAECLLDFPGWHRDLIHIINSIDQLYKWGLFLRDPLPQWSVGRVSLLGDACHAMLPFLGQGANMAIEDACVLARCLKTFRSNPVMALQRYETARRQRTTDIVHRSAAMAEHSTMTSCRIRKTAPTTSRANGTRENQNALRQHLSLQCADGRNLMPPQIRTHS